MKDFILRNSERVLALLLTGIFLALLYFGNQKGLHLWFESGRESGSLGLVTGIFIVFLLGLIAIIWILTDRFLLFVLTKMGYYSEDWSKVVGVIIGKRIAKAPRTRANHFLVLRLVTLNVTFSSANLTLIFLKKVIAFGYGKSECIIKDVSSALFTNSLIDIRQ